MFRPKRMMLVLLAFLAASPQALTRAAAVTYAIQNYPSQQDGWTLAGTITINARAATGNLTEDNVTAWSWTITNGTATYTYRSTDKGADVSIIGTVSYTPTQILLPRGPVPTNDTDFMNSFSLSTDSGYPKLDWANRGGTNGSGIPNSFYYGRFVPPDARFEYAWQTDPATLGGQPWVLAAVPEPSSAILAGIAALAWLGAWARRRASCRPPARP